MEKITNAQLSAEGSSEKKLTRKKLKRLLKIEKTMAAEACLSCGGTHAGEQEPVLYEIPAIVERGKYDRAVIAAEFAMERGDAPPAVAEAAADALRKAEEAFLKGEKTELEYARCVEAAVVVTRTAGADYESLLNRFFEPDEPEEY